MAFGVGVAVSFGAAVAAALVGSEADVPPFPSVSPAIQETHLQKRKKKLHI